jgi:AraC-like DNA-binding protein
MACQGLGMTLEDLDMVGSRLSHFEACLIVRRALRILGNRNPGFELGQRANLGSRGILALACMTSDTLGQALELDFAHPAAAGHLLDIGSDIAGHTLTLSLSPMFGNFDLLPFLSEKMFTGMIRLMRLVSERRCAPISVEFAHPAPMEISRYEDYFGCRVRFGCAANRMQMNVAWLDTPLPSRSPASHKLARGILVQEEQSSAVAHALEQAVLRIIRRTLAKPLSAAQVAHALHMSERTLRRRLTEAGLSFQGLLDECRANYALERLALMREPLNVLAAQMGFEDLHSFRRAFQRWTGSKLSSYRQHASGG